MKKLIEIADLMDLIGRSEFDSLALLDALKSYSSPRKKIHDLLKQEFIVQIKKGIYIFSPKRSVYSPFILANMIHGPSYISLESALSRYGLIPERVERFISITLKRNKTFKTPVGYFDYHHMSQTLYPLGVTIEEEGSGAKYLIASPEKTMMDTILLRLNDGEFETTTELMSYLLDGLRIDEVELRKIMRSKVLSAFRPYYYRHRQNRLFIDWILEK